MKLGKYIGGAVLALAPVLWGDGLINPSGPCTPKEDRRPGAQYIEEGFSGTEVGNGEIAYKPGGCIRDPFGPKRPGRPATPDELGRDYAIGLEKQNEAKEINLPENNERGLACPTIMPHWMHPLMPHIIPGGHGSGGREYVSNLRNQEKAIYKLAREEKQLSCLDGIHIPSPLDPPEKSEPEMAYKQSDDRIPAVRRNSRVKEEHILAEKNQCEGINIEIDTPIGDIDICIGKSS